MQLLDWIILCSTLLLIVAYGTLKTKGAKNSVEYIKGGNEAKWWTVGLSVMATQASAITFLSKAGFASFSRASFRDICPVKIKLEYCTFRVSRPNLVGNQ